MTNETLWKIWQSIPWDEPADARNISELAGVDIGRTCEMVRHAVRNFRDSGLPIASCGDGFYKTVIPRDLARCARTLRNKAKETERRAEELLERIEEGWPMAAYEDLATQLYNSQENLS